MRQPYLSLQAMTVQFIATAVAGEVPAVRGFEPPVRDFDDDARVDTAHGDPNDPAK